MIYKVAFSKEVLEFHVLQRQEHATFQKAFKCIDSPFQSISSLLRLATSAPWPLINHANNMNPISYDIGYFDIPQTLPLRTAPLFPKTVFLSCCYQST